MLVAFKMNTQEPNEGQCSTGRAVRVVNDPTNRPQRNRYRLHAGTGNSRFFHDETWGPAVWWRSFYQRVGKCTGLWDLLCFQNETLVKMIASQRYETFELSPLFTGKLHFANEVLFSRFKALAAEVKQSHC